GPLASWMKVVSVRTALNLLAARAAHRPADVEIDGVLALAGGDGPTAEQRVLDALMTEPHRELVREVLGDALASLSDHDKTVLRMYLLDEASIDAIARVFSVHRATVARWLGAIRATVLAVVNDRLSLRIGASASQVRSLFRELRFDLDLSMRRLL